MRNSPQVMKTKYHECDVLPLKIVPNKYLTVLVNFSENRKKT